MTREQVDLMLSSSSADEWNKNARSLRDAAGAYPDDWYQTMIASGLIDRVRARWGDFGPQLLIINPSREEE